jgi:hypothetical protein
MMAAQGFPTDGRPTSSRIPAIVLSVTGLTLLVVMGVKWAALWSPRKPSERRVTGSQSPRTLYLGTKED